MFHRIIVTRGQTDGRTRGRTAGLFPHPHPRPPVLAIPIIHSFISSSSSYTYHSIEKRNLKACWKHLRSVLFCRVESSLIDSQTLGLQEPIDRFQSGGRAGGSVGSWIILFIYRLVRRLVADLHARNYLTGGGKRTRLYLGHRFWLHWFTDSFISFMFCFVGVFLHFFFLFLLNKAKQEAFISRSGEWRSTR